MKREQNILKYCDKSMALLEIAPYFNPIAAKADGWNCITLDILTQAKLLELAKADPNINNLSRIEHVDIISSATELKSAIEKFGKIGQIDRIISSHNFEHLPNPIKFLRECGEVLKENGILSMAIPNKRETFDYARPLTHLSDWLRYWHLNYEQPDAFNIFENSSSFVELKSDRIQYKHSLTQEYKKLLFNLTNSEYIDTHVSVFTNESFLQLINEVMILGLIPMAIIDFTLNGAEFIVHFKNIGYDKVSILQDNLLYARDSLCDICYKS